MPLDYPTLDALRTRHPAWRLLRSDHAPLAVSFLHRVFVAPNVRVVAAPLLAEALEDELYALREQLGDGAFPKRGLEYLNDWASPEKGWLRKFYLQGSDEPQFDLTPAAEKAIAWLGTLTERSFVGTESRLLTLFELLRQMGEGSEADPDKRLAERLGPADRRPKRPADRRHRFRQVNTRRRHHHPPRTRAAHRLQQSGRSGQQGAQGQATGGTFWSPRDGSQTVRSTTGAILTRTVLPFSINCATDSRTSARS